MKRALIVLLIVLLVGVMVGAGYFGFKKYEEQKIIKSVVPDVKNTSIRVKNILTYETESGSKITYKELIEKLEAYISEIDKKILETETASTSSTKEKINVILSYLKGCQELLRAQLAKNRNELVVTSSLQWADKAVDLYKGAGYYENDYARKTADEAIKDMNKAFSEYYEARTELSATSRKLSELLPKVAAVVPQENLIDKSTLEIVAKKNEEKPKEFFSH